MLSGLFSLKKEKTQSETSSLERGFSLVELIVVVAIFGVITVIVLVGHASFRSSIILGNLAYDVALSVRQAQSFGLGVRGFGTGTEQFNVAYGIHFDSGSNNSYILFVDQNRNGQYDGVSELIQLFTLARGYTIGNFCGGFSTGGEKCGPLNLNFLDIVFDRPEPDALFLSSATTDIYNSARISVHAPQGGERNIIIGVTGQISVKQPLPQ